MLIGAICDGETVVRGFGRSGDTESTIAAVRALGVDVVEEGARHLRVRGVGLRGLHVAATGRSTAATPARSSGSSPGILAGQTWQQFELIGDESLSSRPMGRIAVPLAEMGAGVETADGHLPLGIDARPLRGIEYELPVASAQVKSCVLLAGLYARGRDDRRRARADARPHRADAARRRGAAVARQPGRVTVQPAERLELGEVVVPGDISSAAPLVLAATLLPGSELIVPGVGVNPTRTGFLDVLERMGARIAVFNRRTAGGEPVADLEVAHAELVATEIDAGRGAAARRRAAAVRARRVDGARRQPRPRRGGAAREGDGPDRGGHGRAPGARRTRRRARATASGSAASPRVRAAGR